MLYVVMLLLAQAISLVTLKLILSMSRTSFWLIYDGNKIGTYK